MSGTRSRAATWLHFSRSRAEKFAPSPRSGGAGRTTLLRRLRTRGTRSPSRGVLDGGGVWAPSARIRPATGFRDPERLPPVHSLVRCPQQQAQRPSPSLSRSAEGSHKRVRGDTCRAINQPREPCPEAALLSPSLSRSAEGSHKHVRGETCKSHKPTTRALSRNSSNHRGFARGGRGHRAEEY